MASVPWTRLTLREDGAHAFQVELLDAESEPCVVMGRWVSVQVDGGPVSVLGALAPGRPFHPLNDLQGASLTSKRGCVEGIAERVYAVKVVGTGSVTLLAGGR